MTSRALINPLPKKSGVSLRATIQNPRPRKYASDADRQKAFRERQAVIQVRVAPKAVETFDEIAETLGYSRQEVVYALLMKGLMSLGNWETVGLPIDWQKKMPQFKLPRYEENPMKRKATPAQIAARERFAEMARSGAFKRKAKKNPAKKRSVYAAPGLERGDKTVYKRYTIINPMSGDWLYIVRDGVNIGSARSVQEAKSLIDMLTEGLPNPRKRNPAEAKERKPSVVLITNPQARTAKVKRSVNPNFQFAVQAQKRYPGNAVGYETVAGFPTKAQAQDYVNALLKAYPKGLTLRIMEGNA